MTWLIEYVSLLLNRYEVGRDGRTAHERNKNKSSKLMGLDFGECVTWRRRPVGSNLAKLAVLWDVGVYLDVKGSTGEIIIGNGHGVWRTRTVRRRPEELRWRAEEFREDQGVAVGPRGRGREEGLQGREAGEVARGVDAAGKADHQGGVETAVRVPHEAGGLREVRLQPRLPGMPGFANGHHQAEPHAAVQAEDGEGDGRIREGEECKVMKRGVPREGHRRCGRRGRRRGQRQEDIKELRHQDR